ncbi:MAG TPA: tRNA pseudouridine(55) synthase TruB [Myxococcales bacterium]|jgi:tRNA pseudouridine55 synthase|nr:tRNA pseudouridine(55) synthase TruB [Myxococcales bacterium]
MPDVSGVVVVNKPSGPTSFDVVRRVKGLFKVKRVGHTGTLDPTATGVLPICVGAATKVAGFIAEGEKEYEATVRFGQITDTQDAAGRVLETRPVDGLSEDRIREALRSFVGLIEQTPPMYSARKIEGKRLYELARAGEEVERTPRAVNVDEARLTFFQPPDCGIFVRCSKGTYLRTLAHDLGMRLGCGAHLRDLRRVRVGPFGIDESVGLDELMAAAKEGREALTRHLKPLDRALSDLAELRMDPQLSRRVAHGHTPGPADLSRLRAPPYPRGRRVRLVDPTGQVLAVAESDGVGTLKLLRVLAHGDLPVERHFDD